MAGLIKINSDSNSQSTFQHKDQIPTDIEQQLLTSPNTSLYSILNHTQALPLNTLKRHINQTQIRCEQITDVLP